MPLLSISSIEEIVKLKSQTRQLVVFHFWASWAPQCEQMKNVIEILSKEPGYNNVIFVNIEAELFPDFGKEVGVSAVPMCIFLKDGSVLDRLKGVNPPELTRLVKHHNQTAPSPVIKNGGSNKNISLDDRLKNLVNLAEVMVFMKGSSTEPRCGFSRQLMELFASYNAKFTTFDILSDEEVRQGLKTYSNWPTYPQVYVKGELIGGLDIIKEMHENGDLKDLLPQKESLDSRLKRLVSKEDVMVFMKGTPDEPRCGFSRTLMGILDEEKVKFGHFDILTDDEVRQGLKTFSNWPTYPQVYAKGNMIGGLDIIKELKESGELADALKG